MKVEQFIAWEKEMKVVERFGEQANMRKKIKEYGLKFIHSNWNLNSSYNIYYDFEMIFGVLSKVIFGHVTYCFEDQEAKNPTL